MKLHSIRNTAYALRSINEDTHLRLSPKILQSQHGRTEDDRSSRFDRRSAFRRWLRRLGDIFSSGCSLLFVDRTAVDPRGSCLLPLMFLYLATSLLFTGFCPSINYCSQLLAPSTLWRDSDAREMYANVSLLLKFPRSWVPERRRRSFSSLFQMKEKGTNARRNVEYAGNLTRIRINKHNNILSLTLKYTVCSVLVIHSNLVRSASEERQDFPAKSRRWLAQMLLIRVAEVKGSFVHTFVRYDQKPCPCIQVRQNGSPLGLSVPRLHPGSHR